MSADDTTWLATAKQRPPTGADLEVAGRHYRCGSKSLDYGALGQWCQSRRGQTMVCEQVGAEWLPFRPHLDAKANESRTGGKISREALWINDD